MNIEKALWYLKDYSDTAMKTEFTNAVNAVVAEYYKLKMENTMLKNTKNNCPCIDTSGVKCEIKEEKKYE